MKLKLYVDFDGVILNTIDISYKMLQESDINLEKDNYEQVQQFYRELDWPNLIKISTPINNSIEYLKQLLAGNLYDVTILTHVNTDAEIETKKEFLNQNIPNINVIFVNKKDNKCDVVDCKNTILVDDYMGNLELWQAKGGIPIKFSTTGKNYPCMSIDNLGTLIDKYDEIKNLVEKK